MERILAIVALSVCAISLGVISSNAINASHRKCDLRFLSRKVIICCIICSIGIITYILAR